MYVGRPSIGVGGHEEKGPSNGQGGRTVSKKGQGRVLCWWGRVLVVVVLVLKSKGRRW